MNSFKLTAVGHLSSSPILKSKDNITYTRFLLVGNDYLGRDEAGNDKEATVSLFLSAFGPLAEALANHARKGDQLIIEAHVRANNWIDESGIKQYDLSFIVDGFRFGAPGRLSREEFARTNGEESGFEKE